MKVYYCALMNVITKAVDTHMQNQSVQAQHEKVHNKVGNNAVQYRYTKIPKIT